MLFALAIAVLLRSTLGGVATFRAGVLDAKWFLAVTLCVFYALHAAMLLRMAARFIVIERAIGVVATADFPS